MSRIRVSLFIDGFNIYHAVAKNSNLRRYKWLNYTSLGRSVLSQKEALVKVYFFTAFYPGDAAKKQRHQTFIDAQSTEGVETVLGAFRKKDRFCTSCRVTSPGYEEKESDVNLALHLLRDAVQDSYDKAIILSGDSDLIPAVRMVKTLFPSKHLMLLFPPDRAPESLKAEADSIMRLKEKHLQANQFPARIITPNTTIQKPAAW